MRNSHPRSLFFVLVLASTGALAACSSSDSPASSGSPADDAGADAATTNDAASETATDAPASGGFEVTAATNTALVGSYALVVDRFENAGDVAYNGAFPEMPDATSAKPRVEMEVVTAGAGGAIKRAHFWSYDATGMSPDKFYGCDQSADRPCTGITIDDPGKKLSFASVTWVEVTPDLTGATSDTAVSGGGSVTLAGDVTVR